MTLFAMDVVQCVQYKNYKSALKDSISPYPGGRPAINVTAETDSATATASSSTHTSDGFRRVSAGMHAWGLG